MSDPTLNHHGHGAGGIGQAIVESLKAHGVTVAGTDQNACPNSDVSIVGDLMNAAFCDALPGNAREQLGGLDIVINNAGIIRRGPVTDATDDDYATSFTINVEAPFRICRTAIPLLAEAGGGAIVNTASINGLSPGNMQGIYSISKAAVISMTKSFAMECAEFNVRVNALLPGLTKTKFAGALFQQEEIYKSAIAQIPMSMQPLARSRKSWRCPRSTFSTPRR